MKARKVKRDPNVLIQTRMLTFMRVPNGLHLIPTEEGIEECKAMIAERAERAAKGTLRGILSEQSDMLEYAMGNGWDHVPPEDIGALTDATIISADGFLGDDGKWYPHPDAKPCEVFAHMNYAVEDPIETWVDGKPVFFRGDVVTLTAEGRKAARKAHKAACGE